MLYLILLSVFLGAIGQVLVKYGAQKTDLIFTNGQIISTLVSMIKNAPLMSGIIIYGISFLIWIKVLNKVELSFAYPMVSIGYVIVMLFSYFLFKENITPLRIAGVAFIIIGVIFISRS